MPKRNKTQMQTALKKAGGRKQPGGPHMDGAAQERVSELQDSDAKDVIAFSERMLRGETDRGSRGLT